MVNRYCLPILRMESIREQTIYDCSVPGCTSTVRNIHSHVHRIYKEFDLPTHTSYMGLVIPLNVRKNMRKGDQKGGRQGKETNMTHLHPPQHSSTQTRDDVTQGKVLDQTSHATLNKDNSNHSTKPQLPTHSSLKKHHTKISQFLTHSTTTMQSTLKKDKLSTADNRKAVSKVKEQADKKTKIADQRFRDFI